MDKEVTQVIAQTALIFNCFHNISSAAQQFTQARLFKISQEDTEDLIFSVKAVELQRDLKLLFPHPSAHHGHTTNNNITKRYS
ncbi:hypothetical protein TNCV_3785941 [Trichonephila clavipes]|nr:hypothetical protein TNCV_3785941 [Trichonephila clavipes]